MHLPVTVGAECNNILNGIRAAFFERDDMVDLQERFAVPVPEGSGQVAELACPVCPPFCIFGNDMVVVEHIGNDIDPAAFHGGTASHHFRLDPGYYRSFFRYDPPHCIRHDLSWERGMGASHQHQGE